VSSSNNLLMSTQPDISMFVHVQRKFKMCLKYKVKDSEIDKGNMMHSLLVKLKDTMNEVNGTPNHAENLSESELKDK